MADRIVTVFGGTGFLGRRVAGHLLDQNLSARIASRHPQRVPRASEQTALQSMRADINDEDAVATAVAGAYGVWGQLGPGEDQAGKRRDGRTWDIEPCAEIIPEADAELGAGLGEAKEGIARVATAIAAGAARDFAPCDVTTNVVLGAVGVQRNFGALEHLEQFRLVGMKPCEQAIEP
jgi:hypothetical protein